MRMHKGKLPAHLQTPRAPKVKPGAPRASVSIPSFEEFFKRRYSNMPVKSSLSEEDIHLKFKQSLSDVNAKYNSLRLEPTEDPETIEVFIDEQRNLTLKYNVALLRTFPEESIDALLLHEACHVVTLPNSLVKVPNTGNESMYFILDYVTNYDEYLANVEFVRRFRQERTYEDLKQHQVSLLKNFETIIDSTKTILSQTMAQGLRMNQFTVLQHLHSMVYDSLFFYVAEEDYFLEWCREKGLEGLHIFAGWIFEDFEYIRRLGLSHEETRKKVIISGTLSMSVNPFILMTLGQIKFAEGTRSLHEQMLQRGQDTELVDLWEKRRLLYENSNNES